MNIQGQAALVTGGGSGLGEATARELARLGAKVAVLAIVLPLAVLYPLTGLSLVVAVVLDRMVSALNPTSAPAA